ncbi:MAG: 30S ribosomal protein S6 [Candidatus Omnitrophica bacterium]|nr:30S ribosomal protein S6 [Candidatus Omnitrophota bacterium]
MNREYESMIILKPDLDDQERQEIFDKFSKRIKDLDGEVLASEVWIKERKFYYFLRSRGAEKKKYYKGCYWLINFTIDIEKLPELKETIRLEERILRNLIVSREGKVKSGLIS